MGDVRMVRRLVPLVAVLVLLGGCKVELTVATHVDDDGSGEVAVTALLGETVRQTLRTKELKSEDPAELAEIRQRGEDVFERGPEAVDALESEVPDGWDVERIAEGESEGLRLRASFESLDEIPALIDSLSEWGGSLTRQAGFEPEDIAVGALARGFSLIREGSEFHFRAEPTAEAYEGATGGPNKLLAVPKVEVTLPGGVTEHDADEQDGNTLSWTIPPGESRSISATSDLEAGGSGGFPILPVLLGVGAVGAMGLGWRRWRGQDGAGSDDPPPEPLEDASVLV